MAPSNAEDQVRAWLVQQLKERLPEGNVVSVEQMRKAILDIWELAKTEFHLYENPADRHYEVTVKLRSGVLYTMVTTSPEAADAIRSMLRFLSDYGKR